MTHWGVWTGADPLSAAAVCCQAILPGGCPAHPSVPSCLPGLQPLHAAGPSKLPGSHSPPTHGEGRGALGLLSAPHPQPSSEEPDQEAAPLGPSAPGSASQRRSEPASSQPQPQQTGPRHRPWSVSPLDEASWEKALPPARPSVPAGGPAHGGFPGTQGGLGADQRRAGPGGPWELPVAQGKAHRPPAEASL